MINAAVPLVSDESLMAQVQRGDRRAYEELYGRWRLPIFRFLLQRTCSRDRAEDALQETWMRVYKYRRSFKTGRSFKSWLYGIAVNAGRDARRPDTEQLFLRPEALSASYDARGLIQARDSLVRALHLLSPEDRRILVLAGAGFTSFEIADIMEMSASTVRTRLQRARAALREAMHET